MHTPWTHNNVLKARVDGEREGKMGDMRYRVNNKIKGVIIVVFAAVTE